ncbi:MAG TPA: hypothetical protein VNH22_01320 [Blastocatellia bacterium]|jgi:hypothetical protein|nr:hypothetical protein [Blastocatellia bacterium]
MNKGILALALCAALAGAGVASGPSAPAPAQEVWAGKPYSQWTKGDTSAVLSQSPWVKTQEIRLTQGRANAPRDSKITLRLRSALPIRQALVRQKQLDAKYDKMNEADRAAFDAKTKGLMDCPACADNYVVTLSAKSENDPGYDVVFELLKGATLAALQKYVYLSNDRGERRPLIHFVAPKSGGEEAMFFFPRLDDSGKPLLAPRDKRLLFRFSDSNVSATVNFEFDVSKIVLNDSVIF